MSFADLLISTCTVQRFVSGGTDEWGNPTGTWTDHLTNQPCRINAGAGKEVLIGAEVVVADYKMFIKNVDITEQDRVISDGVTYEVLLVSVREDSTTQHHKACWMKAVR